MAFFAIWGRQPIRTGDLETVRQIPRLRRTSPPSVEAEGTPPEALENPEAIARTANVLDFRPGLPRRRPHPPLGCPRAPVRTRVRAGAVQGCLLFLAVVARGAGGPNTELQEAGCTGRCQGSFVKGLLATMQHCKI